MKAPSDKTRIVNVLTPLDTLAVGLLGWIVFFALKAWRLSADALSPLIRKLYPHLGQKHSQSRRFLQGEWALLFRTLQWSSIVAGICVGAVFFAVGIWNTGGNLSSLVNLRGIDAIYMGRGTVVDAADILLACSLGVALVSAVAALGAFIRATPILWLLRLAALGFSLLLLVTLGTLMRVLSILHSMNGTHFTRNVQSHLMIGALAGLFPWALLAALFLLLLGLNSLKIYYSGVPPAEISLGDRILRNIRTHGSDPRFRKSFYVSAVAHIFLFLILPMLIAMRGCRQKPYEIPKGTGSPVIQSVKITGRLASRSARTARKSQPTSAVATEAPTIDESAIIEEIDQLTSDTYEAQTGGEEGGSGLGAGGGGKGGWPDGMENARVRFIRLEYEGGDWDQDMGFGADYNMLIQFRQMTGFNVWPKTESIRIADLMRFPKNRAPPFVYLTGGLKGGLNVSQAEAKILRKYCLDLGGMIFADNGGGNFDRVFRASLQRIFPDLSLVDIASDDVLYQQPFLFVDGAPPLWHHSGNRALGIKYKGRWVVFYHQGDINDAWKEGHSGASDHVAMQAYKLGINIINYAFNQYLQSNFPSTKRRE